MCGRGIQDCVAMKDEQSVDFSGVSGALTTFVDPSHAQFCCSDCHIFNWVRRGFNGLMGS